MVIRRYSISYLETWTHDSVAEMPMPEPNSGNNDLIRCNLPQATRRDLASASEPAKAGEA